MKESTTSKIGVLRNMKHRECKAQVQQGSDLLVSHGWTSLCPIAVQIKVAMITDFTAALREIKFPLYTEPY